MYIIVTSIAVCVFAAIINGVRLSVYQEPEKQIKHLSGEERLRRTYRNAYYSYVSLRNEVTDEL